MRILLIGSYFFPVRSVASIRWTKLAKYLSRDGISVSVLTDKKNLQSKTNYNYLCGIENERVSDYIGQDELYEFDVSLVSKLWNIESNRRQGEARKGKSTNNSGRESSCGPNWSRALKRNELIARAAIRRYSALAARFDVIISTFDPLWPHMVARRLKEINSDLIWIADFRDPVYGAGRFEDPASHTWAASVTRDADVVTYVADGGKELLELGDRDAVVLSNGFDPDDMKGIERGANDYFRLVYTGALYDGIESRRDLVPIMRVVQSLIDDGDMDPHDVVFEYAGSTSALFDEQVKKASPLSYECQDHGLISHKDALNLQRSASLLAIATWNTTQMQGVVTGKLWEYLMSGVPVIATCTGDIPNSRMKEIIEKTNGGITIEECTSGADMTRAKEYVLSKYREWKKSGRTSTHTNWEYLSQYSHENLAKHLIDIVAYVDNSHGRVREHLGR